MDIIAMVIAVVAVISDVSLLIALGVLVLIALAGLVSYSFHGITFVRDWSRDRAEVRLNRREAALRRTILTLADAIAEERIQARHASAEMVRASYLARGEVPGDR